MFHVSFRPYNGTRVCSCATHLHKQFLKPENFKTASCAEKSFYLGQQCLSTATSWPALPVQAQSAHFRNLSFVPCRNNHTAVNKTHYEVLGLRKTATAEDIRSAFLRKSKECHPDLNRSNPETHKLFVQVNEAYSVLSKPKARQYYDLIIDDSTQLRSYNYNTSYYHQPQDFYASNDWYRQHGLKEEYFYQRTNTHQHNKRFSNLHIVASCMVFMLTGIVFHFVAVKRSTEKHQKSLDERDQKSHEIWMNAKNSAKNFTPREILSQHLIEKQALAKEHTKSN